MTVVDLSSLWAGPLCAQILQLTGARVVKVESEHRPDGARFGVPTFFDLLHAGQESVALDLSSWSGRDALRRLLNAADVVIEASRPRALEQLGIVSPETPSLGGPRAWVSITGYGRAEPGRNWIAFGDDAAVAGGLVAWDARGPCFCADAIADPASGLVAAAATLSALERGGRWLLDISLSGVAASLTGRRRALDRSGGLNGSADDLGTLAVSPPRARPAPGRAPALGEHTRQVLRELSTGLQSGLR
jgi:crotonobetainyl-CoA:carnitine CoA-transferase CaiB-like acyl-CoA transferase